MSLWDAMKALLARPAAGPADARKLDGSSAHALAQSLKLLPAEERGWITFAEARSLFSTMDGQYAFGQMDDDGKDKLASFAAGRHHRSRVQFMPVEGRVYFIRDAL
jgi:hypothetical protein